MNNEKEFKPYIPADKVLPELTPISIILGILLADEPTGNLDPHNAMEIMGLLEKINRRGTTVIVVTHSHEIVDLMKKRVITIDRGMVVCDEEESGYRYED